MIDEKKIEEAAGYHLYNVRAAYADTDIDSYAYPTDIRDIELQIREDFKAGANWAIDWHKKSLWHDASENPERYDDYLVKTKQGCVDVCFFDADGWHEPQIGGGNVAMWLDLADIKEANDENTNL